MTEEMLGALFDDLSQRTYEPHVCIVHPQGGVCFDCGQPWRLVNGRMERVTWPPASVGDETP